MEPLDAPRVYWNLSSRCNINPSCDYCYQEASPDSPKNNLNLEDKYNLIDELYYVGVRLMGFGGGEPTLEKDLPLLIKYASTKGISTQMVSNGTLLNKTLAKKLYDGGLNQIGINLDSVDPRIHNSFRGGKDYWNKALKGVTNAMKAKLETGIVMTVSQRNFHEIEKYIQFGTELGVDEVEFVNMVPVGKGKSMVHEILTREQIKEMFEISSRYAFKDKPKINIGDSQFYTFLDNYTKKNNLEEDIPLGCGCAAGISTCAVQPDLTVTPCLLMPHLMAGDLKEESFEQIWSNSQIFNKLRNRKTLEGKCKDCNNNETCGGCRSMAYAITGNFIGRKPFLCRAFYEFE